MTFWYQAPLLGPDLSVLCRAPSFSGHPGAHLSDTCSGSCFLEACGVPRTLASLGDARQNSITLHQVAQDPAYGVLSWESEIPGPRPRSS